VENADAPAFGAYALLDAEIGRFRAAHPDATFVVASDHGWTFSGYAHYGSQDGILVVSGPRARAGATIPDAHIRDVAPTVLALLDVPLSRELPGRVLAGALRPAPSLRHVAGYGPPQHRAVGTSEPVGGDVLAGLAALGYVR